MLACAPKSLKTEEKATVLCAALLKIKSNRPKTLVNIIMTTTISTYLSTAKIAASSHLLSYHSTLEGTVFVSGPMILITALF